ncbi:ParM/StbA family protein [Marinobacter sp. F3R08]|uniref:ParM/StbA family protein n=1 Tax=Marinobacter sp. F3R08 TaxID=2841559 RepID=UPI001C07F305|nr:ParM/StbA family protein [Marinobacter sp. F3R08]MBU2952173.1 ParM/StbA family protein [Marinobacter sp. F3R08]
MSSYVMGFDIGYSNAKGVAGYVAKDLGFAQAKTFVRPVGAAPVADCIDADNDLMDQRVPVSVDGEPWYAFIEPAMIMRDKRELNYDYVTTKQYRAAFLAGLMEAESDTIDVLVTGLPVSQAMDESKIKELISMMEGEHQVAAKRKVTVKKVVVRPQPSAAYIRMAYDYAKDEKMSRIIREGQTVVLDPGFFSADWVTLKQGGIIKESSGTSIRAMARVIDAAAEAISREYGAGGSVRSALERAMRNGDPELLANGTFVEYKPYLNAAAEKISRYALAQMKSDMALQDNVADLLVLAGGGAEFYEEAARELFPECRHVVTFDQSVTAIAEGYFLLGQGLVSQAKAA